jgi:ribonuclease HI
VHGALYAESEACIAALQAAIQYGFSRIILATNSLSLGRALRTNDYDQAPGGPLFREARAVIASSFIDATPCILHHVKIH